MTIGKFGSKNSKALKKKSKYAGVEISKPRDPMLAPGDYVARVVDCREGQNPGTGLESFKLTIEVVESGSDAFSEGDRAFVVWSVSGKGANAGCSRVKAFCAAAAGYEFAEEEAFDELDADGEFVQAVADGEGEGPLCGRLVNVRVTRGRDREDGDYYREYLWAPHESEEKITR